MPDTEEPQVIPTIDSLKRLRQVVTLGALLFAVAHLIWPELAIDAVTLALIVIAILPWLAPILKSLELPGGWKVEFQELQKAALRAETAGLLAAPAAAPPLEFTFQTTSDLDPNLALAGLRIDIEKRLARLAQSKGLEVRAYGIGQLLRLLTKHEILGEEERSVLADIVGLLNSAVHGAAVDPRAAEWAMGVGRRLLASLDQRITGNHT